MGIRKCLNDFDGDGRFIKIFIMDLNCMQTHHDLRSISGKMRRKIEEIEYSSKIADKKQVQALLIIILSWYYNYVYFIAKSANVHLFKYQRNCICHTQL